MIKLVNETTTEYLEKLKEEAIIEDQEENKCVRSDSIKFGIFFTLALLGAIACLVFCIRNGETEPMTYIVLGVLILVIGAVAGCCLLGAFESYRLCKETLTDERKEEIYSHDSNIKAFLNNLNQYTSVEKVEILGYQRGVNCLHIEYVDEEDIIEEMVIRGKMKAKKNIEVPELVLTNEGFVFYEPYQASH
jgi:predicted transcriptional regulator